MSNERAYGGDKRDCRRHGRDDGGKHKAKDKGKRKGRPGGSRARRALRGVTVAEARELAAKQQIIVGRQR